MIADASTFAEENGLETNGSPIVAAGFTLLDIKLTPVLADFYLWADVVAGEPMREVWRPFLWSTGSLNLAAGLDLSLGDGLTVASVLEAYFKPRRVESIDK